MSDSTGADTTGIATTGTTAGPATTSGATAGPTLGEGGRARVTCLSDQAVTSRVWDESHSTPIDIGALLTVETSPQPGSPAARSPPRARHAACVAHGRRR